LDNFGLLLIILFIVAPLLERLLKAGRQPPEQGDPEAPRGPGQPLPRQQPRRMPPADAEEDLPFRSVPAGHQREESAAADMLPDDLWEVLTGEKRPQPRQRREEPRAPAPTAPVPPPVDRRPDMGAHREQSRQQRAQRDRDREEALERRAQRERDRDKARERPLTPPRERSLPSVEMRDRSPRERERLGPAGPPPSDADRHVRPVPVRTAPVVVSYDVGIPGSEERHARFHERLDRDAADAAAAAAARSASQPRLFNFDDPTELRHAIIMNEVLGRPKGLE
jgi:hypothetical protein